MRGLEKSEMIFYMESIASHHMRGLEIIPLLANGGEGASHHMRGLEINRHTQQQY